jgi:competence protein ComEC
MAAPRPSLATLDVGHGNSTVLIDTRGVVVIDTGSGSALLQYLEDCQIQTIDVILLSHADEDHIGALAQLLACGRFKIGRARLNTDSKKGSQVWDDLLYELSQLQRTGQCDFEVSLVENVTGEFDQGEIHIEILAPSRYIAGKGPGSTDRQGRVITSNSVSAVVRLVRNGQPIVLLPGDLDSTGLANLIEANANLVAPVLVFPHHGGRSGSDLAAYACALCNLVAPKAVIFSIGRGRYGTPQPEIVAEIRRRLANVRVACTQLSEHCANVLPEGERKHLSVAFSRGKELGKCCAGTILINLDGSAAILPTQPDHLAFIASFAQTALCQKAL